MTTSPRQLIDNLSTDVTNIIARTQQLKTLGSHALQSSAPGKWNVLQVIWHLESYNAYYLAAIEAAMRNSGPTQPGKTYTAGWAGNYFTRMMQPDASGKVKGMKAPAGHIPAATFTDAAILDKFLASQQHLLQMLEAARSANLQQVKVSISIAKWLKIRLGDTFRFLIAHQQRHMLQITNILAANQ